MPLPIPAPNAPPPLNVASAARSMPSPITPPRAFPSHDFRDACGRTCRGSFTRRSLSLLVWRILAAYWNSFGVTNRSSAVNWTLDNKYIIELDLRTKVDADVFRPSTWADQAGKPDFADIWTRDYWWPKGISGRIDRSSRSRTG